MRDFKLNKVTDFVAVELKGLEGCIVATPDSRKALEAFAKANGGSMDLVLMQMAIQFGAQLAYENVREVLSK